MISQTFSNGIYKRQYCPELEVISETKKMQYVGKVGGYVYNQWNALNPATLLGAIDVIVIERPDGSLHCSPWHVRFGKFQIIKPLQKKIDLYVNDIKTDLPMKLGEGGEAFFVFETANGDLVSQSVVTSPVLSATSSAEASPMGSPRVSSGTEMESTNSEPEALDLNLETNKVTDEDADKKADLQDSFSSPSKSFSKSPTPVPSLTSKQAFETARKVTKKLNIPSKIDINGDMVLDMDGYKPNSQKNIDVSDEFLKKKFLKEIMELTDNNINDEPNPQEYNLWDQIIQKDKDGNIRIINKVDDEDDAKYDSSGQSFMSTSADEQSFNTSDSSLPSSARDDHKTFFKTLRLTSEQLKKMNLHYGPNKLAFKLNQGSAEIFSYLYLWKSTTPIVISDIDGTITKSDALGHVLNLIGKDWTHPGVAKLFHDISLNGYNIVYLTARSVGQADSTRQYLQGINQDGVKLPMGPVILSPDRTIAALKREVILKKPEVFKMSCLNDIKSLYFSKYPGSTRPVDDNDDDDDDDDDRTPFYAGFGNRITDAISYRSVKIPSHRIFTINPNGEVHMELLELAGYRSSYLHIGELVDHFFPPIKVSTLDSFWNDNQLRQYINSTTNASPPGSPEARSLRSFNDDMMIVKADEKYNDVNYWREPLPNLSDFSDDYSESEREPKSPGDSSIRSAPSYLENNGTSPYGDRAQQTTFSSPLKNFMMFGAQNASSKAPASSNHGTPEVAEDMFHHSGVDSNDAAADEIDNEDLEDEDNEVDYDDDYTDDDYDDDYEDEEDYDEDDDFDEDYDEDADREGEDPGDLQDGLSASESNEPSISKTSTSHIANKGQQTESLHAPQLPEDKNESTFVPASDLLKNLKIE